MTNWMMSLLAADAPAEKPAVAHVAREGWEQWSDLALDFVVYVCVVAIISSIVMCLWRILKGPTLVDRGIASDTIAIQVVALVILLTVVTRSLALFDAVLIVSILGFAGTVAFAQFIGRRGNAQ